MLGLRCYQIADDSLAPAIPAYSYVVVSRWHQYIRWLTLKSIKVHDIVVIKHPQFGYIAKRIAIVDKNNFLWGVSAPNKGLPIEQLGPISREKIVGTVLFVVKSSPHITR